ncbi:MAG TPA: hypothetical protein ENJ09_04810 [Planctomycetes bacterium]|nr:hypothetical protein [Planctomycetota bacterium]
MTRGQSRCIHAATALVGVSGLVYGWMRYFAVPEDEFAVVNHPWQPALQASHILFAPLLVFAVGLVWRDHIWARISFGSPARRRGGLVLTSLVFPMIASGYLLQTATSEAWRTTWIWVHGVTGCLWLVVYLIHQATPKRLARRGAIAHRA